jgi:mycothiol synthase
MLHLYEVATGRELRCPRPAQHDLDRQSGGRHAVNPRVPAVRHFWHMRIDLDDERRSAGGLPAGIEIRGVDPSRDLAAVHEVLSEAFVDDASYWPRPLSEWMAEETASPSYDATLWLLAVEGDVPVGALAAGDSGGRGWVNEIGVRQEWRGRGIGAALLRRSFAEFSRRGLQQVTLNVDAENPTGATALYERVGMRVVRAWDLWEKDADDRS